MDMMELPKSLKNMYKKNTDIKTYVRNELWRFFTRNQLECIDYKREDVYKGAMSMNSLSIRDMLSMPVGLTEVKIMGRPLFQKQDFIPIARGYVLETEKECEYFKIPLELPHQFNNKINKLELECKLKKVNGSFKGIRLYLTFSIDSKENISVVLLDIYHNEVLKTISFSV